jgi:hypothetical protein
MKILLLCLLLLGGLWLLATVIGKPPAPTVAITRDAQTAPLPNGKRAPVVVELFTSEGCSSCPPADALLQQLSQSQPLAEAEIIALSEHVDYWNYIGWADPFSSPAMSARQEAYAQALGRSNSYTPQMVVDGQLECVGSNAAKARAAIAQAARLPKAAVQINASQAAQHNAFNLRITVNALPARANEPAEIVLAITEDNLASAVSRGENSGRKLLHTAVTRELRVIGRLDPAAQSATVETSVTIPASWKRDDLRAIAFAQERSSRRILGAASLKLN